MEWNARRQCDQCCNSYFKGKGDIMKCGMYGCAKLLEHAMKIVEEVLEKSC